MPPADPWATEYGAELDGFGTVTLDRIRIEPGAQIEFLSGTAWNIVVPEPATWALWLTGLAGFVAVRRPRQRR